MLDNETKQRINTARDILVGKVPDPKSQVEQITIALTYKFMDDMDQEALAMGGKASFFVGEYEKYGWTKMFDPHLGGFEMLALYSEAITRMSENPHIEPLFRQIFKNAYLPYRDPETLKLFLKTINEFRYDHSEKLGDAFEYLLSVLGSQGDAGQFRTPRHIIEFMVAVVAPKKHETILDPACGTAGFLISAYKFIRQSNTEKLPGDLLSVQDRARMVNNFSGYDISPDMVRLSLVNMYLHGFTNPRIHEYDTLTSEERWHEYADVILANPPFMSPKGGIRPHKKFSVQSKRSEVLFVDYMAEHLTASGRAAIIVPEGIIFQSGTAYKELRKYLVEKNYLWAVVSLPSGVFQPYSGVKTSILFMDKVLARKTNQILFVKVENDGFDLGAQRRPIDKNDLPAAQALMQAWQQAVVEKGGEGFEMTPYACVSALLVEKARLAENGEYNLTGERFRDIKLKSYNKYEMVKFGDSRYFQIESGGTPDTKNLVYWDGDIQWATLKDLPAQDHISIIKDTERKITPEGLKNSSAKILPINSIIVSSRATIGRVGINLVPLATNQGFKNIVITNFSKADPLFVAFMIKKLTPKMELLASGGTFKELSKTNFSNLEIPLPPLEVQREIVAEIEGYQRIIDGARMVVENWKPNIELELEEARKEAGVEEWEMVKLGEVCELITDGTHRTPEYTDSGVPFLRVTDITQSNSSKKYISREEHIELIKRCKPEKGDVLYSKNGTIGIAKLIDWDWEFSIFVSLALIKPRKEIITSKYLEIFLNSSVALNQAVSHSKSGTVTNLHLIEIKKIKIPIPPIIIQKEIVDRMQIEEDMILTNKKIIEIYNKKIQKSIEKVWLDLEDVLYRYEEK